jgi:hypothetical protein
MGGPGAPDDLSLAPVTQAWLAVRDDPAATVTAGYFYHQPPRQVHPAARDTAFQDQLLGYCASLTGDRTAHLRQAARMTPANCGQRATMNTVPASPPPRHENTGATQITRVLSDLHGRVLRRKARSSIAAGVLLPGPTRTLRT